MLRDEILQKTMSEKGRNLYFLYTGSYVYTQAVEAFCALSDDVELSRFDEKTEITDIVMMADTVSMFVTDKVIVLSGFTKPLSDVDKRALKGFLASHDESVTVVLFEDAGGKKPLSFAAEYCVRFDYSKSGPDVAQSEIAGILAKRNIRISPAQCRVILNKCQRQLDQAVREAEKLSFYLDVGQTVSDDDIAACVIDSAERKTYEVADLLSEGRIKDAVSALQYFKINSVASSFVLASFAGQYRRLLYTALTKKSDDDLADIFGVKAFSIKSGRAIVAKYKQAQIKRMLESIYAAEYSFKSGVCSDDTALCDVVGRIVMESAVK